MLQLPIQKLFIIGFDQNFYLLNKSDSSIPAFLQLNDTRIIQL